MNENDALTHFRRRLNRPLRIGLSARIFHPDPTRRDVFRRTLQVLEQNIAHWVLARRAMVLMVPTVLADGDVQRGDIRLNDYAEWLDGLVLQGGADLAPQTYGHTPLCAAWSGDPIRDAYELELLDAFISRNKPVLGICRGMQLINVAYGGTLHQDLPSLLGTGTRHESEAYDTNLHGVDLEPGGLLDSLFAPQTARNVVSIHHQAVETLGKGLVVEARSAEDGVVEAIRLQGSSFVLGVQWHPEFHRQPDSLNCNPLLDAFLREAAKLLLPEEPVAR